MSTVPDIIQITLEEAIDAAWVNFLSSLPFNKDAGKIREICCLCFTAGFLDGVKMKNLSDQLKRKET